MKSLCLIFLFVTSVLSSIAPIFSNEENVIVLNSSNFGTAIDTFTLSIILFYEPQSEAFLNVTTEFNNAAKKGLELFPGVKFCKMDGEIYRSHSDYYGSKKLPSINLFYQGFDEPVNYTGSYTSEKLIAWIQNIIDDRVLEVTSMDEIQKEVIANEHTGLFIGSSSSKAFSIFLAVSTVFNDVAFIWSSDETIKQNFKVEKEAFVLFRQHNKERNKFVGPFNFEALKNFTRNYKYQSVMALDKAAAVRIFDKKETAVFLLRANVGEAGDKAQKEFVSIGNEFRGRIALAVAGLNDTYGSRIAPYLGVTEENAPAVMILDYDNKQAKYRLDKEITAKNIRIFLMNFFSGNLNIFLRSAPIPGPEEAFDGNIKIVVGKTYYEVTSDPTKHVLIEFYSPICKICQSFAPVYSDLAQKLSIFKDLIIAKIDGSVNDVENLHLEGFPAIFLYPKKVKNQPLEYLGDKSQKDIYGFLKNHTDISLKRLENYE